MSCVQQNKQLPDSHPGTRSPAHHLQIPPLEFPQLPLTCNINQLVIGNQSPQMLVSSKSVMYVVKPQQIVSNRKHNHNNIT